nr:hypothetical protein [Angustibacter aerolatus]
MPRLGVEMSGRIDAEERAEPGRALARLSDLGWGSRLAALLGGDDAPVDDSLVEACVGVLRDWGWARRPVAVVQVPSRRRPQLVGSLAERLATIGRLRLLPPLDLVDGGPTGEAGGNSAFRLAGVWGRIVVGPLLADALRTVDGPVLLVDDLVDSRWTLTVAAREPAPGRRRRRAAAGARQRRVGAG